MEDIITQLLKDKELSKLKIEYWAHDETDEQEQSCLTKVTIEREYY